MKAFDESFKEYHPEPIEYKWDMDSLDKFIKELYKDYVPYIEDIGNGLYRVNGDSRFFYITDIKGAEEADRMLKLKAKEYATIQE